MLARFSERDLGLMKGVVEFGSFTLEIVNLSVELLHLRHRLYIAISSLLKDLIDVRVCNLRTFNVPSIGGRSRTLDKTCCGYSRI